MNHQPIADPQQNSDEQSSALVTKEFSATPNHEAQQDDLCCGDTCQVFWKPSRVAANPYQF